MERLQAKICLCTDEYPPLIGGVGIAAQRLARNLARTGAEVHVVTPNDTPGASSEIHSTVEDGCQVYRIAGDFRKTEAAFRWRQFVRKLDSERQFDLFHGFYLTAACACLAISEQPRRPLIVSIRGDDALKLFDHPFLHALILAGLRRADWVTSVNELYLQRVGKDVDIAGRCSVIRNGVEPGLEQYPLWELTDAARGVVGLAAEFRRGKEIPLLIRAYAALPRQVRRRLLLTGYFSDPDEESWSQTLISEFGLADEVQVTGPYTRNQVFGWMRAMHVYVQCSAFEGLPNTLLEAASLGIPLVATAVGGMREVLTDEETALLVPHGEPAKLARAIERILTDDDLALRLSAGARRLTAELSAEHEFAEWISLYRRLLSPAGTGS
jgi:glycosyltransferase involved in cell wall biosynthesis